MTKEQAAQILDAAISQIQTTRGNHQKLVEALNVLMQIAPNKEVSPKIKEKNVG